MRFINHPSRKTLLMRSLGALTLLTLSACSLLPAGPGEEPAGGPEATATPFVILEYTPTPTAAASPSAEPFPTFISGLLCSAGDQTPEAGWAVCRSLEYGFSIQFPADGALTEHDETHIRIDLPFAPDTNLLEKYIVISAAQDLTACSIPVALGFEPGPVPGEAVTIAGVDFVYEEGGGVATGNIYDWLGYSAVQGDVCVSIGFVLHSFSPGVMETPPPVFDRQVEIAVLQPIVASFRWLNPAPEGTPIPSPSPIPESSAERIAFPAGGITGAVSGELGPSGSALYVLYAFAGQTLTAELDFDTGAAILIIWGADGEPLLTDHAEASFFEGLLPASQDYYILVKAHPELGADYTLTVTIPPLDG